MWAYPWLGRGVGKSDDLSMCRHRQGVGEPSHYFGERLAIILDDVFSDCIRWISGGSYIGDAPRYINSSERHSPLRPDMGPWPHASGVHPRGGRNLLAVGSTSAVGFFMALYANQRPVHGSFTEQAYRLAVLFAVFVSVQFFTSCSLASASRPRLSRIGGPPYLNPSNYFQQSSTT